MARQLPGVVMPLVSGGNGKVIAHVERGALGFWTVVKGADPVEPVRLFVSYEAFADLDSGDLPAAFQHFDRFRARIETAASKKFDRVGTGSETYEGMLTILLTGRDLA